MEGFRGPIALWIVPHDVHQTGVGGDHMVASHDAVDDTSLMLASLLVCALAPFLPCLSHQRVDDVECRVEEPPQVCQMVGHTHQVVIVGARASTIKLAGHQAKEIFQTAGHTHKGVVLDQCDIDHFVGVGAGLHDLIFAEHLPAAGGIDPGEGRAGAIGIAHAKFLEQVANLKGTIDGLTVVHGVEADIDTGQLSGGLFA